MLEERASEKFIGHDEQLKLFRHWLADTSAKPWILFFHDALPEPEQKGGVGKTWLLRQCAKIADQQPGIAVAMIDFFNVADRNSAEVARHVVDAIKAVYPDWRPEAFEDAFLEYREANRLGSNLSDPLARLYDTLTTDLDTLEATLERGKKSLLIFFDTYELIEDYPVIATLNPLQIFPDRYDFNNIGVVIAGRNAPDWTNPNWQGREDEVRLVPVTPFSPNEMVEFLNENRGFAEELRTDSVPAHRLYELTQGRPILVGLVMDVLNYRIITLDDLLKASQENFEEYIVSKINELENPINWVVLFMSHIYHRFNKDMLVWLFEHVLDVKDVIDDINAEDLWRKVPELSFVRRAQSGNDITLHDEMRRLVNKYNWRAHEEDDGSYRQELSASIIKYYQKIIDEAESSRTRQTYTVEQLYHRLFVNWDEGFAFFVKTFNRAINQRQNAYARSLLQEVKTFSHERSIDQERTLRLCEADLLRREESNQAALDIYAEFRDLAGTDWYKEHYGQILYGVSNAQLQMSNLREAMRNFKKSLEIYQQAGDESRAGTILARLGYIHRRFGELDEAADYYEQSLVIHKRLKNYVNYASTLNDRAGVYRLKGQYEEALRKSLMALRIRQSEYSKARGGASEIGVGQSYASIGHIYLKIGDLPLAEKFFDDALAIYKRNRYKKGLAAAYNRFGQIAIEKSEFEDAVKYFKQAYDIAHTVDPEAEIGSLHKQGLVLVLQGQPEKAIPFFERASQQAREVSDIYQQVECLVDLGDAYERLKQPERADQMLQEAEKIADPYKYYFLLGRIQIIRAERPYKVGDYELAFRYLGEYCHYMAIFNPVEYEKAVRITMERLLKVPGAEFEQRWNQLHDYWHSLNLDEEPSRMHDALEDVQQTMVV